MGDAPAAILVLYQHTMPGRMRAATRARLRALARTPRRHELLYWNAGYAIPAPVRRLAWDAVLLDATFLESRWLPEFPHRRREWAWLVEADAVKVALPQDDYLHAETLEDWLLELGVDVVFSVFEGARLAELYPRLAGEARFARCLTGYVDADDVRRGLDRTPHASRPLDLAYRASDLPYALGRAGQLKSRVARVGDEARARGLRVDVSVNPQDTIRGGRWLRFLASSRCALGAESGSTSLDRRGELAAAEATLREADPELGFEEFSARMPAGWDDYAFLAIGPRHLEAAVARTCQVLVEGAYSGILEPDVHYVPVRADLTDAAEAIDRIADPSFTQAMADRAHRDLVASGRFSAERFAAELDAVLAEELPRRRSRAAIPRGTLALTRAGAKAYDVVVVRPPRWAYRAAERVAPGALPGLRRTRTALRARGLRWP